MDKYKDDKYELIAKALFESYETIYDINLETSAFDTFHESEDYKRFGIEKSGDDFFALLPGQIKRVVVPKDQHYVMHMLKRDSLITALEKEKYYSFIYRLKRGDKEVYHQLRATYQPMDDGMHVFMGVQNIDAMMRRQNNNMQAVLATAAAYIDANITRDIVIEKSDDIQEEDRKFIKTLPSTEEIPSYSGMHAWICDNIIAKNKSRYKHIGSRANLLKSFDEGKQRVSVFFSVETKEGGVQPCREVIFLYEDDWTKDVHALCVIYDLTEQQKKEKEMAQLERELQMSRIRNFTSQMQPHFLYNALGSIQEIILIDPEYASELLGYFTVHLRSCIRAMTKDEPLDFYHELENIKAYVNIEKMRFGEKLRIHYDIGTMNFSILPLTIQPLVENAIRHGIYGRGPDGGDVYIKTRENDKGWSVQIEDNGIGFDLAKYEEDQKADIGDSTGIRNIRFRLEQAMNASLEIESEIDKGTKVTVRIPKG